MSTKNKTVKSGEYWRYPEHDGYPPKGQMLLLLNKGGSPCLGSWQDDGFMAWAPLPQRDSSKEPKIYLGPGA